MTKDHESGPKLVAPTSLPAVTVEPGVAASGLGPAAVSDISVSATLVTAGWELPRFSLPVCPEGVPPLTAAKDTGLNPRSVENMAVWNGDHEGEVSSLSTASSIPEASLSSPSLPVASSGYIESGNTFLSVSVPGELSEVRPGVKAWAEGAWVTADDQGN